MNLSKALGIVDAILYETSPEDPIFVTEGGLTLRSEHLANLRANVNLHEMQSVSSSVKPVGESRG